MKHTIGKVVICFLQIFFYTIHATSVVIELADNYGKKIDHVFVGIPFQLKVIVKGHNTTGVTPSVNYPEDFICQRSGIQMHSVNGASTTIYAYRATALVAKQYTLGPATITVNGAIFSSDALQFNALAPTQNNQSPQPVDKRSEQPFIECVFEKTTVFVGEVITCRLRFYCPSNIQHIELKKIQAPQLPYCLFTQKGKSKEGIELIQKKPFKYIEWEFDVQFLKEETIIVPPFVSEYTVDNDEDHLLFGGFSMFFQQSKIHHVQTDPVEFNVKSVPMYNGKAVTIVGQFSDFASTINPTAVKINDAAVFTLQLTGLGNFSMINHIPLQNIDPSIKVYESQSKMDSSVYDVEKTKLFEYILQASQPGEFKIPSQELVFFDPKKEKHIFIQTNDLSLVVKPDNHSVSIHQNSIIQELPTGNQTMNTVDLINVPVLETVMDVIEYEGDSPWLLNFAYKQARCWFLFLLIILFAYYIMTITSFFLYSQLKYRFAYINALIRLKRLEKNNDRERIISVFKNYVLARCCNTYAYDDKEFASFVTDIIKDKKLIADWTLFYADLMEAAYGTLSEVDVQDMLWPRSYYWLRLLKKKGL
ncbi:hypothetical protein EKK58_05080 [Candidatus Dependentiae bacterium]|nr:MAG: hypothetical protein EKK58_05080 [Candidatus Dependentiae bacterium]